MSIKKILPVYICEKCNKVYLNQMAADMCCKEYHCDMCGVKTRQYELRCPTCHEKVLFEKATKYTPEAYNVAFPGHMLYWNDHYYSDIEELIEDCDYNGCDVPEYVYGTSKMFMRIDAYSHLEQIESDIDCDEIRFCDEAWKEYKAFADQWNKKYEEYCFYVDNSIIVMIPKEISQND